MKKLDFTIKKIKGRWILDSRGNPTVECDMWVGDEIFVRAAVPSGASTGETEAVELRDNDTKAFHGKGVSIAVSNVNDIISDIVVGRDCREQKEIDKAMIEADGTDNKAKLGANAILSVSMCALKAAAKATEQPLYSYIYELSHGKTRGNYLLPIPSANILNGGKHAGGNLAPQEFMIQAIGAKSFAQATQMTAEVYQTLKGVISKQYGATSINVGDEGGFAPSLDKTREALDLIMEAIEQTNYTPGLDIVLAMDPAAAEFYDAEAELYSIDGKKLTPDEMVDFWEDIINDYPIKSMEDPFDEDAFGEFAKLTKRVRGKCQVVDDDLTTTNVKRLSKAIKQGAGNSLLMKINQIGSISEAIEAAQKAFGADYTVMVSHRSGETCDSTIADMAVGLCSGQIKLGAPCRSDRCAKYNQILRIEEQLGPNKSKYPKEYADWKLFQ